MGGSCPSRLSLAGRYRLPISAALALLVCLLCWITALGLRGHYLPGHSFNYDVRDYGATGDGLAIDTAALQSAINAAAARGGAAGSWSCRRADT